jgi:hypothetical protein
MFKKSIFAVAASAVLFATPASIIANSAPALSQTASRIAKGSTPVGNTAWQQYPNGGGVFVDVDTSSAGFTSTPVYITSIGGSGYHWAVTGASAIYYPTARGFRVYIRFPDGSALTPEFANQYNWHINWVGVGN